MEWKALSTTQQRVLKFGGAIRDQEGRDLKEEELEVRPLLRKVNPAAKMWVKRKAKTKKWRENMERLKRLKVLQRQGEEEAKKNSEGTEGGGEEEGI